MSFKYVGSQELKAKLNSEHTPLIDLISDLQSDYERQVKNFIKHGDFGYWMLNSAGEQVDVTPEQTAKDRLLYSRSASDSEAYLRFIQVVSGKEKCPQISSGYGAYSYKYTPASKLRADSAEAISLKAVLLGDKSVEDVKFSKEQILEVELTKLKLSDEIKEFVDIFKKQGEVASKKNWSNLWSNFCENTSFGVKSSFTSDIVAIRDNNVIEACKRPNSKEYCTSLYAMVSSRLSGWYECLQNKREDMKEKQNFVNSFKNKNSVLFEQILNLYEKLRDKDYGLRRHKNLILAVANVNGKRGKFNIVEQELVSGDYAEILKSDKKQLKKGLTACLTQIKLNGSSEYIRLPEVFKNQAVPFGLTGLGSKFKLNLYNNNLVVEINGYKKFTCAYNFYFHFDKIEKTKNGYKVYFRHRRKNLRKRKGRYFMHGEESFSQQVVCEVKEIHLRQQGKDVFVRLPFTIEHDENKQNVQNFFMSADKAKTDKYLPYLADSYIVAGFDAGISKQTLCLAKITKGATVGNFGVLDYGRGDFIKTEWQGLATEEIKAKVKSLRKDVRDLMDALREVKSASKTNKEVAEATLESLKRLSGLEDSNGFSKKRKQIQHSVSNCKNKLSEIKAIVRKTGNNNIGDCFHLLSVWKQMESLIKSYMNLHVREGDKIAIWRKSGTAFTNFRSFVSKKIASIIAKFCLENKVDILFAEDIKMKANINNSSSSNAIATLFAPNQLLQDISNALLKIGVVFVQVCPKNTSRTNVISGLFSYRPGRRSSDVSAETQKKLRELNSHLYWLDEKDKLCYMDADKVGAACVLLNGLNHSIHQTSFWLDRKGKVSTTVPKNDDDNEEGGESVKQRVTRFVLETGLKNCVFVLEKDKVKIKSVQDDTDSVIANKEVFCDAGGFYTKEQWFDKENKIMGQVIKHLEDIEANSQEIHLTPSSDMIYNAFQLKRCMIDS